MGGERQIDVAKGSDLPSGSRYPNSISLGIIMRLESPDPSIGHHNLKCLAGLYRLAEAHFNQTADDIEADETASAYRVEAQQYGLVSTWCKELMQMNATDSTVKEEIAQRLTHFFRHLYECD